MVKHQAKREPVATPSVKRKRVVKRPEATPVVPDTAVPTTLPGWVPMAAGASAAGIGTAWGLASDKQVADLQQQLNRPAALEPHETPLTRYTERMSPAARLSPFGVPAKEIVPIIRSNVPLMTSIGRVDDIIRNPSQFQRNRIHYGTYAQGPIVAYDHMLAAGVGGDRPGWEEYAAEMRPHFNAAWRKFKLKRFGFDDYLRPHEIDTKFIPQEAQAEFFKDYMDGLPPELQAKRHVMENTRKEDLSAAIEGYKPLINGTISAREQLKTIGAATGGAALGGLGGHYLHKLLTGGKKQPGFDPGYSLSTLGGAALGGYAGYANSSPEGRQGIADSLSFAGSKGKALLSKGLSGLNSLIGRKAANEVDTAMLIEKQGFIGTPVGAALGYMTAPDIEHRGESVARGAARGSGTVIGAGGGALAGLALQHHYKTPGLAIGATIGGGLLGDYLARQVIGKPSWEQERQRRQKAAAEEKTSKPRPAASKQVYTAAAGFHSPVSSALGGLTGRMTAPDAQHSDEATARGMLRGPMIGNGSAMGLGAGMLGGAGLGYMAGDRTNPHATAMRMLIGGGLGGLTGAIGGGLIGNEVGKGVVGKPTWEQPPTDEPVDFEPAVSAGWAGAVGRQGLNAALGAAGGIGHTSPYSFQMPEQAKFASFQIPDMAAISRHLANPVNAGLVGAGIGGLHGLVAPGYDENGKPRSSVMGALRGAGVGGMVGAGLGAGAQYMGYDKAPTTMLQRAGHAVTAPIRTVVDLGVNAGKFVLPYVQPAFNAAAVGAARMGARMGAGAGQALRSGFNAAAQGLTNYGVRAGHGAWAANR